MNLLRVAMGLVAAVIAGAAIAGIVMLGSYEPRGAIVVIGTLGLRGIILLLTVIAGAAASASAALLLYPLARRRGTGRLAYAAIMVGATAAVIVAFVSAGIAEQASQYYSFTSPEGGRTVIIEERTFLHAGDLVVYAGHPGDITFTHVCDLTVDDGTGPMAHGDYRVSWLADSVRLEYEDRGGWHTEDVRL